MICIKKIELAPYNLKAFDDFIIHDRVKTSNPNTLRNHKAFLRMFLGGIDKNYNTISQMDIDLFFGNDRIEPTTREVMKPVVKHFLRFHKMKKLADLIPTNSSVLNKPTKGEESVLTPEEINKLIEAHHDLSRKALIETFVVTGARKDEIRNLNLGDVSIDGNLVWVNVRKSKTKARKIPIAPISGNPVAKFPEHLINWVRQRKNEDKSRPLFVSNNYKRKFNGQRLSEAGIYEVISAVKQKAGVTSKVTPHIFRHTGATYDGQHLNESMLCQKYGWVVGSQMARMYCHFNEKQLAEQILRQAGLKSDETKKGKVCPRCGELNNLFAEECTKCNQIIDAKKLVELAGQEESKISDMNKEMEKLRAELNQVHSILRKAFDIQDHPEYYETEKERIQQDREDREEEEREKEISLRETLDEREKITPQEKEEEEKRVQEAMKKRHAADKNKKSQ